MHKQKLIAVILFSVLNIAQGQYFKQNGGLRFDFNLCGDKDTTIITINKIIQEPFNSRSTGQFIDTFDYGTFRIDVADSSTGQLLYSQGFGTLFDEWQTTAEAQTIDRCFIHCCKIPEPVHPAKITIRQRGKTQQYKIVFHDFFNPATAHLSKPIPLPFEPVPVWYSGDPNIKLDFVLLAEGYKKNEMKKFRKDIKGLTIDLLSRPPFNHHREHINIWYVSSISEESGTDEPAKNKWRNTIMDTRFSTFNTERYLMTDRYDKVCDLAALAPYDQIVIVVNTSEYGGGAIYNFYSTVNSRNRSSGHVLVHETGHCLGGLGDEYYTSEVPYLNPYDTLCEPWEPNLTTLVDFGRKWKSMVNDSTPIPTPLNQQYIEQTGAFEGGGYMAKGMFRSAPLCIMFSNAATTFCPVCHSVLKKKILFYTKK